MRVLVINPYQDKLLLAMSEAVDSKLGTFLLIGDKLKILEKCYLNKIDSKKFSIYDFLEGLDLLDFCLEIINKQELDLIVFDDVGEDFQKELLKISDMSEIGMIDVIDFPFLRHYLFVSSSSRNHQLDYEEKRKSIIIGRSLMRGLRISEVNTVMVSSLVNKIDILELNIIKMLLKEHGYIDIQLFNYLGINDLFNRKRKDNIYNSNINLLVMRNYEMQRLFIDSVNNFSPAKTTSILSLENTNLVVGEQCKFNYYLNLKYLEDANSIVFALSILEKIIRKEKEQEKDLYTKTELVV